MSRESSVEDDILHLLRNKNFSEQHKVEAIRQRLQHYYENGVEDGRKEGADRGYACGYETGKREGKEEGITEGYNNAVAMIDTSMIIPYEVKRQVLQILRGW